VCSTRIAAPEATHGVWEWPLPPRNHEPNVSANIEQSTSGRWRCTSEACRGKLAGGGQLSEKSTAARRGSVYRRARTAWSLGASRESAVARELIVRSLGFAGAPWAGLQGGRGLATLVTEPSSTKLLGSPAPMSRRPTRSSSPHTLLGIWFVSEGDFDTGLSGCNPI
jgi:hypothetical protein